MITFGGYDESKCHAVHAGPRCGKFKHNECHANAMYLFISLAKCDGACIRSGYRPNTMPNEKDKTGHPHYWVEVKGKVWDIGLSSLMEADDWIYFIIDKDYFYDMHGIELVGYWDKNNFIDYIPFINVVNSEPEKPWQKVLDWVNPGRWKVEN
jgi:hypothetical protein